MQSPLISRSKAISYSKGILTNIDQTICGVASKLDIKLTNVVIEIKKPNALDLIQPKYVSSLKIMKPLAEITNILMYCSIPQDEHTEIHILIKRSHTRHIILSTIDIIK